MLTEVTYKTHGSLVIFSQEICHYHYVIHIYPIRQAHHKHDMCEMIVVEKTTQTASHNLRPGCALGSCRRPGRTLPHRRDSPAHDRRTWDLIVERTGVDVDKNSRIIGLI